MRRALRAARLPAFLTLVAIVLALVLNGRAELVLHVYVLVLAAILSIHLLRGIRAAHRPAAASAFESALRRPTRKQARLPQLERIEREVALGTATAFDLHYRLRPSLQRVASELLAAHRGIGLETAPEAARKALGDPAWEIVRPDRAPPAERSAPGLDAAGLRSVVVALEAL
jgi:hypothetical protein